jgi:2-polyprenyl-3-methyl-5-hydroxy-6-metoxy-1,4-benzoquinol methylase
MTVEKKSPMERQEPPSISEQKQFWEWLCMQWKELMTVNDWKDKRHDLIFEIVRALPLHQPRILDLGCGPGWYTERLSQLGETTGVDLSEEAIQMARTRFPGVNFIAGDLYELSLPDEHFDLVVSQEVFDHVVDQERFLQKVALVLKPGGYFILSCANRFVLERWSDFPRQPSGHIGKYSTSGEIRRLLGTRFKILRMRSIIPMGHGGVLRLVNSIKLNRLASVFVGSGRLERLKERAGFGYTWIVLAQKPGRSSLA